jgi:hypothetical protein
MRIGAVLRHPAERAFSNYLMYRRERLEKLRTFRRAIKKEKQRINSGQSQGYGPHGCHSTPATEIWAEST